MGRLVGRGRRPGGCSSSRRDCRSVGGCPLAGGPRRRAHAVPDGGCTPRASRRSRPALRPGRRTPRRRAARHAPDERERQRGAPWRSCGAMRLPAACSKGPRFAIELPPTDSVLERKTSRRRVADDPTAALRAPGPGEPRCPHAREAVKSGAPSAATLRAPIKAQVACPSTISTDGNPSYGALQTIGHRHTVCNMSALPNPAH